MAITILCHHFHYHHGLYEYDYGKYHFPETCVGETLDDEDDDGDYGNDDVVDNGDHNPHHHFHYHHGLYECDYGKYHCH